jgi:hypothetical protein
MEVGSIADWFAGGTSAAAVIVALGGYWFSEWQRRRDKRDRERDAGNMIGVKLAQALNKTDDIRRHLWAPYAGPPIGGDDAHELWRRIQPLTGLQDDPSVALSEAEINLLIRMDAHQFMMDMMLVITRYQSIHTSMKEYALRYNAIMELTPAADEMNEGVTTHRIPREQYMRIKPYANALEGLLLQLRTMSAENVTNAQAIAVKFQPLMKAYFKTDKFLGLGVPPAPLPAERAP